MTAYYNEFDPYAAQWLRNLINAGHIANGEVDERSITDVKPDDLKGFTQCHFFAGIGGWSLAARLAGWSDDQPLWTGSCPCQPFSLAGKRAGKDDDRHLWPSFSSLIVQCQPAVVFGEQVEDAISQGWLDEVYRDMEKGGYAMWSGIVPASSVEADHERQRLFWVANSVRTGWEGHNKEWGFASSKEEKYLNFGNPLSDARSIMGGDLSVLLSDDGVSIAVECSATKGYGNAIVPEAAAEVIKSYMDTRP